MDVSTTALRVFRTVAERGSFSAAAAELGYTQSAVSRQIASLERQSGVALFDRHAGGARLTTGGAILLRHARRAIDELDSAERELGDGAVTNVHDVRLGTLPSAAPVVVPALIRELRASHPGVRVTSREGTTASLIRSLRVGTIDLAVISARPPYLPPDTDLPALEVVVLDESALTIAASTAGHFAGRHCVSVAELGDVDWIVSPSTRGEPLLGVWPGLAGRPRVVHVARDWLTKLTLVAADCGVTTVPPSMASVVPAGVRLLRVQDGPAVHRRALLARLPGRPTPSVDAVMTALRRHFPR